MLGYIRKQNIKIFRHWLPASIESRSRSQGLLRVYLCHHTTFEHPPPLADPAPSQFSLIFSVRLALHPTSNLPPNIIEDPFQTLPFVPSSGESPSIVNPDPRLLSPMPSANKSSLVPRLLAVRPFTIYGRNLESSRLPTFKFLTLSSRNLRTLPILYSRYGHGHAPWRP